MDREIIRHIANMANISLSENEEEKTASELTKIVEYISKIQGVLENLPPFHLEERETRMRNDEAKNSLPLSFLNKLSNFIEDNQFKVPKFRE